MAEDYLECAFMIPLVRNSDKQPHGSLAWRDFDDEVNRTFVEGSTGPERLYQVAPVPGRYSDSEGRQVDDESWRYDPALPAARIDELRALLRRDTFDQESIYLSVGGRVELVYGKPEDGFLGSTSA